MTPGRTLAVASTIALVGSRAWAQAPTGHEGHHAPVVVSEPAARVMEPQPSIPEVSFVDQAGEATTLRQALASDQPVLVNFIFTSCTTICPVMSAGMAQLMANLGGSRDDVRVVSISIDPAVDTVETLRAYALRYHAPPAWRFLTGTPSAVEAAQRAFGGYRGSKLSHAPGTYVRPAKDAPWIALDGFSSAETLRLASRGLLPPARP